MSRIRTRSLTFVAMAALTLPGLTACGGADGDAPTAVEDVPPRVAFTYPLDGQQAVPVGADVVLSFDQATDASRYRLVEGGLQGGTVAVPRSLGDSSVLRFDPAEKLAAGVEYWVVYEPNGFESRQKVLTFHSQAAGPQTDESLRILGQLPGEGEFPFVTFSTLRLRFSKPLDSESVVVGDSFQVLDPEGEQVPGTLKVGGDKLVFDPREDLTAGARYQVVLTTGVKSTDGRQLPAEWSFYLEPQSAGAITGQQMKLTPTRYAGDAAAMSEFTGQPLNTMVLRSTLTESNEMNLGGSVQVDIADPRNFDRLIPFTIRKGQLIASDALVVELGGEISSGLDTGRMYTEFLTDATGYFMDNPYTEGGPVTAVIFLDLGVSASNDREQGVVNAEILQVQASGVLEIKEGVMYAEAFGALELDVQGGADRGTAIFDMMMKGPISGESLQPEVPALRVVSTYPNTVPKENGNTFFGVDDTILVNFSGGIDPKSVPGKVFLYKNNNPIEFRAEVNGATIMVDPLEPLAYGADYQLEVQAGVASVAGAVFEGTHTLSWATPAYGEYAVVGEFAIDTPAGARRTAPQLLSLRPGVPCVLEAPATGGPLDVETPVEDRVVGWCAGGKAEEREQPYALPKARGADTVEAYFTQPMDASTLILAEGCQGSEEVIAQTEDLGRAPTIFIERIDEETGECVGTMTGRLHKAERHFKFLPDRPWGQGKIYRTTLVSDRIKSAPRNGAAAERLNSNALAGPAGDGGAEPSVVMHFVGWADDGYAYQPLSPQPYTDVNGDFHVTGGEVMRGHASSYVALGQCARPDTHFSGDITDASIDDHNAETDATQGMMFMNYVLLNEIGPIEEDPETGERYLPVRVLPQFQAATSLDMTLQVLNLLSSTSTTHQTLIRPRAEASGRIYAVEDENGVERPMIRVSMPLYIDAPYMALDSLAQDSGVDARSLLHGKQVTLELQGPVTHLRDGRIALQLTNTNCQDMTVSVSGSLLGISFSGNVYLRMPPGTTQVNLVGPPLKGVNKILGKR